MNWTQTWFLDGKCIGQAPCKAEHVRNEMHPPLSLAFFCPVCGDVWARRMIEPATRWNVLTRECKKHPSPRYCEPQGSVWIEYDKDFLDNLPKNILQYETLLRLESDK